MGDLHREAAAGRSDGGVLVEELEELGVGQLGEGGAGIPGVGGVGVVDGVGVHAPARHVGPAVLEGLDLVIGDRAQHAQQPVLLGRGVLEALGDDLAKARDGFLLGAAPVVAGDEFVDEVVMALLEAGGAKDGLDQ
ncbi:hypothetical protein D3C86_1220970 [compost metagenome]